jgi:predicted house-cleaning noncanonical NTP pyrophosphatase (MazG superfamily)
VKYIISNKTFIRDKINEIIEEIGELEIIHDIEYLIYSPNLQDVLRYYTKKNNLHVISQFCEIDKVWDQIATFNTMVALKLLENQKEIANLKENKKD